MSDISFFHRGTVGDCYCWEGSDPGPVLFSMVMNPKILIWGIEKRYGGLGVGGRYEGRGGGISKYIERKRSENTGSLIFTSLSSS